MDFSRRSRCLDTFQATQTISRSGFIISTADLAAIRFRSATNSTNYSLGVTWRWAGGYFTERMNQIRPVIDGEL
jgi:hypothetical protein